MLEEDIAKRQPFGQLLIEIDYADAVWHCPELFVPVWQDLAQSYAGEPLLPFLKYIRIYEDGTVTGTHVCYSTAKRKLFGDVVIENDLRTEPFGKRAAAAAAAREYVERKRKEIQVCHKKQVEGRKLLGKLLAPLMSGKGKGKR